LSNQPKYEIDTGIFHLQRGDVVEQIPWARKNAAYVLIPDLANGGLWLGFAAVDSGLSYFKDGQTRKSYSSANGLGAGNVMDLRFDSNGALWAATKGGLSRVENGRVATLTSKNGLPCDTVPWSLEDNDHSVWLYMACGLVRIARSELDAWAADPNRTIQATVFDSSDGVRSHSFTIGSTVQNCSIDLPRRCVPQPRYCDLGPSRYRFVRFGANLPRSVRTPGYNVA
jgi:ligand-binding sensor domain-containing protein